MRISKLSELPPPNDHTMFSAQRGRAKKLPLTESPIRFAILYRNGCTSNSWKVETKPKKGDAYIFCRDNMQEQHISLHASGSQHITIKPRGQHANNLPGQQFMNRWQEPERGTATFRLVFPWWGVQLNAEQLERFKSTWETNAIFIEGHREFLTVIAFYIAEEQTRLNKVGEFPGFVLAELPLRAGKKLAITAEWHPDRGFLSTIREGLKKVPTTLDTSDLEGGETLGMCMTGTMGSPNSVYMVSFPATFSKSAAKPSR